MTQNLQEKRNLYFLTYMSLTKQKKHKWDQQVKSIKQNSNPSPDEWLFRLQVFAHPELFTPYLVYIHHYILVTEIGAIEDILNLDSYSFDIELIIPNFSTKTLEEKVDSLFNYIKEINNV